MIAHLTYSDLEDMPDILISQGLFQSIVKAYYEMDKRRYDLFQKGLINCFNNIGESARIA